MSQQIDSKIVELAKKWGLRFIQYARLLSLFNMEEWLIPLSFLKAWLNGCQIIGRYLNYVYVRCNNKLVRIRTTELLNYSRTVRTIEEEVKEIEQLKTLDEQDLEKMVNNSSAVLIDVSKSPTCGIPRFAVFGDEAIYLMNLEDVSLYLNYVYINSTPEDSRFVIEVSLLGQSDSGYEDVSYYVQKDGTTRYLGRAMEKIARETILRAIPHEGNKKEDEIVEEGVRLILDAVDKKISIIDKMLEDAEDVFIKGLKELTAVFLY